MDSCAPNCDSDSSILCQHRFNFKVQITYCNGRRFSGVSDLNILYYFLNYVHDMIDGGSITRDALFVILTKDTDFLKDAEAEWLRKIGGEELVFTKDSVKWGDIVIFAHLVNCKNYGTKGRDDLKCIVYRMNKSKRRPRV